MKSVECLIYFNTFYLDRARIVNYMIGNVILVLLALLL